MTGEYGGKACQLFQYKNLMFRIVCVVRGLNGRIIARTNKLNFKQKITEKRGREVFCSRFYQLLHLKPLWIENRFFIHFHVGVKYKPHPMSLL